nr:replication-relaxation family protein [Nonomuraea deserti]
MAPDPRHRRSPPPCGPTRHHPGRAPLSPRFRQRHRALVPPEHQVGVNEFFAQLHATARHRADGSAVAEWWPERRCATLWGDLARPDAFGRWTEPSPTGQPDTIDFFLEHDTGTETLSRVLAKLDGYTALAEATGITTPVLFWLPSTAREANLRKLLTSSDAPTATAVHTPATAPDGPAGPVWLPAGSTGPRRPLIALRDAWGTINPHSEPV